MRILIVSDNATLSGFLMDYINNNNYFERHEFDYRFTIVNKQPQQMLELGMSVIDMNSESSIKKIITKYKLIISLHCKQIFREEIVSNVRCVNFHPGYNPYNRGWFPQVFSIINGLPLGVTVHLMDKHIDHGGIIIQRKVEVLKSDTSLSIYNKLIDLEKNIILSDFINILEGDYEVALPSAEGNYNGINDFRKLCELNLQSVASLGDHINLLRALTHGKYKNAYYYNEEGRKTFISVNLEVE